MCRGKDRCTVLGTNPNYWDKYAPLRHPEWMLKDVDLFVYGFSLFYDGKTDLAIKTIKEIKSEGITNWYIEHGQMSGRYRMKVLNTPKPISIDIELRDNLRSPKKLQDKVFERDNYHCRYCGIKLISQMVMKQFISDFNQPFFQRGRTNISTHGIIHLTWPVADHIMPWNIGGKTDLDNLVSSCATCNYGKDGYTLEQMGILNPLERAIIEDGWQGLI